MIQITKLKKAFEINDLTAFVMAEAAAYQGVERCRAIEDVIIAQRSLDIYQAGRLGRLHHD
ncbi:hypothetical protein [Nioella nitratireducens]|uniref:hypothetical protein n=1 Tax=Nioella nitratireducens TaxID=1287720 RepID=UPI0011BA7683|nr:hypothetical protein [Nioella nitratireducens]